MYHTNQYLKTHLLSSMEAPGTLKVKVRLQYPHTMGMVQTYHMP
jgi:hypothetical protein